MDTQISNQVDLLHVYSLYCDIALGSSQIFYVFVLRVEIVTVFEPKVVAISARNTIMRKFANFVRLYFPHITTFFNQILEFYYFEKVLVREFGGFLD